ncbi:hypothetical protein [Aliivibrio fischeri]|uniref:hypothetical protein n=1 Tax=Aliivibrio fischeri TaxID=668 RepID=UPI00084C4595|nr:hypothetical protein [Aliivibrio fischeri]OED54408.1 hypothetical protein BEI47_17160 [Aliivibrio fischeri]
MSLQKLRVLLRQKSEKELIDEIADLYKKFDVVKRYYKASLLSDDKTVFHYSQTKIIKSMQPKFSPNTYLPTYKIAEAKKIISEYKKISSNDNRIVMLMLFYVTECINIINEYDDVEKIQLSGISTFKDVIKLIKRIGLNIEIREEIEHLIQLPNENNEMGDTLKVIYKEANLSSL